MNCSEHATVPAVAACGVCGRGLCNPCADANEPPTCTNCTIAAMTAQRRTIFKQLAVSTGLFVAGGAFGQTLASTPGAQQQQPEWVTVALTAYLFAGAPYGWRALRSFTSRLFLRLPVMGWVFYFACKLSASVMVGAVVTPFTLAAAIRALRVG